ncbi:MAG: hypothetical protein ACFFAE_19390 [Candidatus Hodarchaeota archaeon]
MVSPKYLKIDSDVIDSGLIIHYQNTYYEIKYPDRIWVKIPPLVKKALQDNLALATTLHLPMVVPGIAGIRFSTARPLLEPYFFQNFIRDIPSCTEVDGTDTDKAVRKFLQLKFEYADPEIVYPGTTPIETEDKAIISASLGKDSLLTYAVAQEIGLNPEMVYIVEQSFTYELKHKTELGRQFKKEFGKELHILKHDTGKLRDYNHLGLPKSEFGWGLQSTEYAIELIPFAYAFKGKYIFFGNEQSCASSYFDEMGNWRVYPCYDQTHIWTTHIDQITKLLTGRSVQTGSLIEPLMDMMVQRILVHRYPEIAKYQMSCFTETEAGRDYKWCQNCFVCAKMYLMCVAGNVDPKNVGFTKNMLELKRKSLFTLFGGETNYTYTNTGLARDEQLFAFYLAVKNGVKAELVEYFHQSRLFLEAKEREDELIKTFCSLYDPISLPNELKSNIISIYKEELDFFEI